MTEARHARLVDLGHALDARVDAPYLIGVGSKQLEFTDSILVGPFSRAQTDDAWRAVERTFHLSGAYFVVFVRDAGKAFDRARHVVDARAVLLEMPYFSTADIVEIDTWCVARCDAGGSVLLEADGRVPIRDDARAARRLALRAAPARAVAMLALVQRHWHTHM